MPRVLVVEDSKVQAQEITFILEGAGYEVVAVPDAEQALELLAKEAFDLVISDLSLPKTSGIELCSRIKAERARWNFPVVLLTRWADPVNVLRGLEAGADGFITKGREPEELLRRLERVLDRHRRLGSAEVREPTTVTYADQVFRIAVPPEELLEVSLLAFEDQVQLDKRRQEELMLRRQAEDEVRKLNQDLERRVSMRTAELGRLNRDLAQKSQENEMFVYSVSHDLRSPLVNLEGFSKELSLVCDDIRSLVAQLDLPAAMQQQMTRLNEQMTESIQFIKSAVMRLSGIIDALLRLSRVGRVEYQCRMTDTQPIVARIVHAMAGTAASKQAKITVKELPAVWSDAQAVEQIFANLMGNALNYLEPTRPGLIDVGCQSGTDAQVHCFYVQDNGRGIPEAYRNKVFQAFQRLHPDAAKGEGMGLALVRRIVERLGGKIWFESSAGVGTRFLVTLPAAAPASQSKESGTIAGR